ncbi:MAG TPA: peptidase M3 [Micromonosporaceae bacterium]|nr:peptidase M3 [Micromonosporaceae bacterium]
MSNSAAAQQATSTPEEFTHHAESVIAASRADVTSFVDSVATGEELLEQFDELTSRLDDVRRLARAVSQCHPDAAMRAAADAADQATDKVATEISLDARVYERLRSVDVSTLDEATQYLVFKLLRSFRRAGVDRDEATRARLREIRDELVSVGQSFQRNINADTRVVTLPPNALDGLPDDFVRAHPPHEDGQVRISTDYVDSIPFMTYAHDSGAREQLWRAFNLRGYPQNIEVLRQMLELRKEFASLLGYASWARYVTEDKMIGTDKAAADFIARISAAAYDRMCRDTDAILQRRRIDDPNATEVLPWDSFYLEDRIKAEQLAFDSQTMRPYFEFGRVRKGLMAVAERLFGVEFRARKDIPVWHHDVEAFDVFDADRDTLLGRIFLDMHPRKDKFGLAAMCVLTGGKAGRRIPECALLCNFPRPGEKPALMQHVEVTMFFHEFGHLMHHVLAGRQRWAGNAGVKTEPDFVEAPSQLLEEWTRDASTLATFARHHETGEALPATLVEQMRAAEEFGKGLLVRRQLFFADLSLELHRRDPSGLDPLQVEIEMWARHDHCAPVDGAWMHL